MISIIIPTFNRLHLLQTTVAALSMQKPSEPFEIIIVDSGNDNSEQTIKAQFPHVVYLKIKQSNNRSLIRHRGVEKARYEVLIFLDNDMIVPPGYIQAHWEAHRKHDHRVVLNNRKMLEDFDARMFPLDAFLPDTAFLERLPYSRESRSLDLRESGHDPDHFPAPWRFCFSHGMSVRKSHYLAAGGFDPKFGANWGYEDMELGYRLYRDGLDFLLLEDVETYHQPHPSGGSGSKYNQAQTNKDLFYKRHREWDVEVIMRFGSQVGSILKKLQMVKQHVFDDFVPREDYKEDVILGCLLDSRQYGKQYRFGVYMDRSVSSIKTVRIVRQFFHFEEKIRRSILTNALYFGQSVIVEINDPVDITLLERSLDLAGLVCDIHRSGQVVELIPQGHYPAKDIKLYLPSTEMPSLRRWYILLALWYIKQKEYQITIHDPQGLTDWSHEEFSLDEESIKKLESVTIGQLDIFNGRSFCSENHYLNEESKDGAPSLTDVPRTTVFLDRGYRRIHSIPRLDRNPQIQTVTAAQINQMGAVLTSGITKQTLDPKKCGLARKSYLAFMLNGFQEDNMETILNSIKKLKEYQPVNLVIKVFNLKEINKYIFPLFNKARKEVCLFDVQAKNEEDLVRLKWAVAEMELQEDVTIIEEPLTTEKRMELYNGTRALIDLSGHDLISTEVWEAIHLNCPVVIGEHKPQPLSYQQDKPIVRIPGTEKYLTEALGFPASASMAGYKTHVIDEDKLLDEMLYLSITDTWQDIKKTIRMPSEDIPQILQESGV